MIIVVEGISASGKTSWCARQPRVHVIDENIGLAGPDRAAEPLAAARFWADAGARRWTRAEALAAETGLAICDTDPLKLHYIWTLWRIGAAPLAHWQQECAATRAAIAERRLGFADAWAVKPIDPALARAQRAGDAGRARRNFDLHLRLQPALLEWYENLSALLPGRVTFGLAESGTLPAATANPQRHDIDLFDRFVASLPG
jgi:hypothetical protein